MHQLDLLIKSIEDRFNQPGYRVYSCLEQLLLKSVKKQDYTEELTTVIDVYQDDFQESNLITQLKTLSHVILQTFLVSRNIFSSFPQLISVCLVK